MVRRYRRKAVRRPRRRVYRRRRGAAHKALRMVRSLSRKVAAEVKKADAVALIQPSQMTLVLGDTSPDQLTLRDYGYLYPVFGSGDVQGIQLDDFVGEQVRAKYLYVGLHLQLPTARLSSGATGNANPVTIRVMIVQDRNYEGVPLTALGMFGALFGPTPTSVLQSSDTYGLYADSTLLPINPQQPGRFRVLRDFRMNVAPGWRQDYYKKIYIRQNEMLSRGRIYYGNAAEGTTTAPGDSTSSKSVSRNAMYVFVLLQQPIDVNSTDSALGFQSFSLSLQSRFAYYDN